MIADRVIAARRESLEGESDGKRSGARLKISSLGGATLDNEENYLIKKLYTSARGDADREPGPHMTLRHRAQFGHVVWPRRRHDVPTRPAELRLHRDPGFEHGRVPPGRLPVGHGGEGPWREADPRRPAVHPHVGDGRHPRAVARWHRHRVPWGARQLRAHQRARTSANTSSRTPTRPTIFARTSRIPRTLTASSPDSTRRAAHYDSRSWQYEGTEIAAAAGERDTQYDDRIGVKPAAGSESHGSGGPAIDGTASETTRCSTRDVSIRCSNGTSRATRPRWSSRSAACRPSSS